MFTRSSDDTNSPFRCIPVQAKNGYGNQAVTNEMQRVPALMGLLAERLLVGLRSISHPDFRHGGYAPLDIGRQRSRPEPRAEDQLPWGCPESNTVSKLKPCFALGEVIRL